MSLDESSETISPLFCRHKRRFIPRQILRITQFSRISTILVNWGYLGLMKFRAVKAEPKKTQTPATTIYAIPRKSFCPPITVRVDNTIVFVPLYSITGKSNVNKVLKWHTVDDINLIRSRLHNLISITKSQFSKLG